MDNEVTYYKITWKIKRGNKIRLWEDVWLGEASLHERFPRL